jgi:hypothetical protein
MLNHPFLKALNEGAGPAGTLKSWGLSVGGALAEELVAVIDTGRGLTLWVWRKTNEELTNSVVPTNEGQYQLSMKNNTEHPLWKGDPLVTSDFKKIDTASFGSGGAPIGACEGSYKHPWGAFNFADLYSRDGTIDLEWGNIDNWAYEPGDCPTFRRYNTWGYYWTGEHEVGAVPEGWPGAEDYSPLDSYNWGDTCNYCPPSKPDCKYELRDTWPAWYEGDKTPRYMTYEELTKENYDLLKVQFVDGLVDLKNNFWAVLVYPEAVTGPIPEW